MLLALRGLERGALLARLHAATAGARRDGGEPDPDEVDLDVAAEAVRQAVGLLAELESP